MAKWATWIAWFGWALFTYIWLMRVGSLRDEGKSWLDALVKKNDMYFFGITGLFTMLAMLLSGMG